MNSKTHLSRWGNPKMKHVTLLILCALFLSKGAVAQATDPDARSVSRRPVLVTVVDTVGDAAPGYRIVRLAGELSQDVILLPEDASPELLTEAVEALRVVWQRAGERVDASATVRVVPTEPGGTVGRRRAVPWGEKVLQDLRTARERHVPGVGRVRALRIWLPRRVG